jgi:RNA polymerase subunit RPABC4/transcription elongation factor Spt4
MKIKCPACDFENEEDSRFCKNCNEPLIMQEFSKDNPFVRGEVEDEEWIPGNKKRKEKDQPYIREGIIKDKSSELFLDDLVKENVDNKKRLRTCGNCGASLPDGVTKCPECEKAVCKNCGNVLGTNVTKCPKCGELTTLGTIQSIGWTLFGLGLFIYIILFFLNNL